MTESAQLPAIFRMALLWFCAQPAVCSAEAHVPTTNVVRQIDHILISSSRAKELFSLLTETFEFPVAWPMSDYGGFSSGGAAVGNVNLEIVRSAPQTNGAASSRFIRRPG